MRSSKNRSARTEVREHEIAGQKQMYFGKYQQKWPYIEEVKYFISFLFKHLKLIFLDGYYIYPFTSLTSGAGSRSSKTEIDKTEKDQRYMSFSAKDKIFMHTY